MQLSSLLLFFFKIFFALIAAIKTLKIHNSFCFDKRNRVGWIDGVLNPLFKVKKNKVSTCLMPSQYLVATDESVF